MDYRPLSINHDVFSRSIRSHLLATRQYEADSTGTENGGLHQEETKLRPAGNLIRTRLGILTSPLLDALFHCRTPEQRFPAIREIQPGVIDERGDNDWSGNPHIGTGTHNKRQGNTATCTYKRIVPLRRRRRICRRHRFCRD